MPDAGHISDDDLERLVLRMVEDEAEREQFERHLLLCAECRRRARKTPAYIRTRKAGVAGRKPARKPMGKARRAKGAK